MEYRKLTELKKLLGNPRTIKDESFKKLCKSIEDNKDYFEARPLILSDRTGELIIIGGNQRFEAAKHLKIEQVPTYLLKDLTEEREKEIIIRDNVNNGDWDMELLANNFEIQQLEDWGVEDIDFKVEEIDPEIVEDEVPELKKESIVKKGDVWILGEHRLKCGDSTLIDDVDDLMGGDKADMVFTDPPYNIEVKGGGKGKIRNALKKQGKDIEFISNFKVDDFLNCLPIVFQKNKINAYIFCNKELLPDYLNWAKDNKYSFNVLIWKKPNAIPIGDSHRPDIEYLLLFRKSALWNNGLEGVNYSRCLEYGRESGLHPTMKPIELITNEIKISSNKKSIITDLFLGSGSTLIACEQTNRKCYGMELDEHYCTVIIFRWLNLMIKQGKESEIVLKCNNEEVDYKKLMLDNS